MLLPFDIFDDPTAWSLQSPDGQVSGALTVTSEAGRRSDRPAIRLTAGQATDHVAETTFDFVDLNPFDDLQVRVSSNAPSDGRVGYLAEFGFGATNLSPTAPSNTWRRYVPIEATGTWELVVFSITDLPERVRNRCNRLQIRFLTDRALTLDLAELSAVATTPITDIEQSLVTLLHQRLSVDGAPVPAVVAPDPPPDGGPHFRIRQLAASSGADRARTGERRTDFTATGYLQRPPIEPLDVDYSVDAVGPTRATQRALADFLLTSIRPTSHLEVNGADAPMTWGGPLTSVGDPPVPSVPLRVTIPRPVSFDRTLSRRPHERVSVSVDQP